MPPSDEVITMKRTRDNHRSWIFYMMRRKKRFEEVSNGGELLILLFIEASEDLGVIITI
jgi:hypothetical protein